MRFVFGEKSLEIKGIERRDLLLIIGLCLAPMTGLRIGKIGPGEVLCLLWGIKFLIQRRIRKNDITTFFVFFILSMCIGSIVGNFVAPNELRISDLFSWLYLGIIAISITYGLRINTIDYNEKLLFTFANVSSIWYLFLFVYSRVVSRYFFGAPIWYGARFSAGATNPHQIAVLLCGLNFVYLRRITKKKNLIISLICIVIDFFLLIQTDSSTGILAVALGIVISAYFLIGEWFPGRRKIARIVMLFIIALLIIIGFTQFWNLFIAWVAKDQNGLGRLGIFASFPEAFMKSPVFGLGPGVHGRNGLIEFHNTYLEILVATGAIGGAVFVAFSYKIITKAYRADWSLIPIIAAMYAYGLAGFAMRRLVFWGLLAFVVAITEQRIESDQAKKQI